MGLAASPLETICLQLFHRRRETAAGAAERVSGTHDEWQTQFVPYLHPFLDGVRYFARRCRFAQPVEQRPEQFAVLRRLDRLDGRAEQPHVVPVEYARLVKGDRQVQPGLPAERRQQTIRALPRDDALDDLDRQRLDVDRVGHTLVRHDGRRVGVHEDDGDTFLAQRLTCLRSRIVELGGLPNDDGPAADDEHFVESGGCVVGSAR